MITGSDSKQNKLIATQRAFSATGSDPARGAAGSIVSIFTSPMTFAS
jgi:hypothetical protein